MGRILLQIAPIFCLFMFYVSALSIENELAVNVALIGDSLISRAYRDFDLTGKVEALLPDYKLTFSNYAFSGARILDVKTSQIDQALETNPDIVLLFWDSDCSDVNERNMTLLQTHELRKSYTSNLEYVIKAVLNTGAYIAVGGPEVLGEGPIKPRRFWGKNPMLDDYRQINIDVTNSLKVYYMDIRQAFLDIIPFWWLFNSKYLTVDGEHENSRGTEIVASFFADAILNFIESKAVKSQ